MHYYYLIVDDTYSGSIDNKVKAVRFSKEQAIDYKEALEDKFPGIGPLSIFVVNSNGFYRVK